MDSPSPCDYTILETLGEKSVITTYRALEKKSNNTVIIKVISKKEGTASLLKELERLMECDSEFLIMYYRYFETDEAYWVVMEYNDIGSLDELAVMKYRIKKDELREIASCCLISLDYLHSRHIIHADIKPSNLFLTENGVVKLGDYGLVPVLQQAMELKSIAIHQAPEAFDGKRKPRSDVWSLGVLLYELAEGRNPYAQYDISKVKNCIQYDDPLSLSPVKWPADFVGFVKRCWATCVQDRSSVKELMRHPFVRDSIKRIQQKGPSEVFQKLIRRMKLRKACQETMERCKEHATLSLFLPRMHRFHEGVAEVAASRWMQLEMERVIEVDIQTHQLLKVNGESVSGISPNKELLLKATGERWEGDTLNNQPYGWGVLTDGNNKRLYEGFRIGGMNVCYGILYNRDSQKAEYEGGICNGKRWGRGTEYDRNGNPVYDGEWLDDRRIEKQIDVVNNPFLLHNHVEDLIVSDGCCKGREWKVLDFSHMPCLRVFCVGNSCFENVEEVRLVGLKKLTKVVIGMGSFRQYEKCSGRRFLLKDCKRIRELRIGNESFYYYSVCEIQNVDSLEEIEIGGTNDMNLNFELVSRFELKNLPRLKSVRLGYTVFSGCSYVAFQNLPRLTTLGFGDYTFQGCSQVVFENLPELTSIRLGMGACAFCSDSPSELIMRNLPKLTSLMNDEESGESFQGAQRILLENMPSLTEVNLPSAFEYRRQLSYNNIGALADHPNIPRTNPHANIHSVAELQAIEKTVEVLVVGSNACNDAAFTQLDLSSFSRVRAFEVGEYSFAYVQEVRMIGLSQLERVAIGSNCFTASEEDGSPFNGRFCLKNCERVKELRIDHDSFVNYSLCEIESLPSLEVIHFGELDAICHMFISALLNLINLPKLKSLVIGSCAFSNSRRAMFQNLPALRELHIGYNALESCHHCIFQDVPSLTDVDLSYGFKTESIVALG
ncbi:hypothetical protein WA577_006646, partial [Blastocystis sp. JDR]